METTIMATVLNSKGAIAAYQHPTPSVPTQEWACADVDPDVFFPTDETMLATARSVCDGCGLKDVCLSLGQARGETGVWGGELLDRGRTLAAVPVMGRPRKQVA